MGSTNNSRHIINYKLGAQNRSLQASNTDGIADQKQQISEKGHITQQYTRGPCNN